MGHPTWLRAVDCPLLQPHAEEVDSDSLRFVQRLLERALSRQASNDLAKIMLEEIGATLRADQAVIWQAEPAWKALWQNTRHGMRFDAASRPLLHEVLDREAGVSVGASSGQPAVAAACLSFTDKPNRVVLVTRREDFSVDELGMVIAAGHYLGVALEQARLADATKTRQGHLQALVSISQQLVQERETVPLLEHIAEQSAKLLECERATIFLWDQGHKQLVGRPALGLPNGELRIPDSAGVVGKVFQGGQVAIVDNVRADSAWSGKIDAASGFQTRSLLCVPLHDRSGVRLGALEVMNKAGRFEPDDVETLQALASLAAAALDNVREREALVRSHSQLDDQARLAARIIGESTAIVALRSTLERVANTDLPVLILGESGTGKDVVARALHYSSPRAAQPFIPVNCAAIAETLLESELFGHEKGAFTGADTRSVGKFEAASGGSLFLDEIGDLSLGGQAKLLRVLEEKIVYRVGGTEPIPVDTRVFAATNRHLSDFVRAGKFREDLLYRLTVVTLELPPLRDRREDILVLAEHFLAQFCRNAGRKPLKFSAEARKRMEQHDWPGNVRELRNLLERVAYLCPNDKVEPADLAFTLRPGRDTGKHAHSDKSLAEATDAFQIAHIQHAIDKTRGNMKEAAELLGLYRPNLYRKMKLLGMKTQE